MKPSKQITGSADEKTDLMTSAAAASDFLKALANQNRLVLLCLLAEGEKSVSELESTLGLRQPTISQQLGRLRADGLVSYRREGKTNYYSLASEDVRQIMEFLYERFCAANVGTSTRQLPDAKAAAE